MVEFKVENKRIYHWKLVTWYIPANTNDELPRTFKVLQNVIMIHARI